jgi:hypothetical protein
MMKLIAQKYKTYEGARKRAVFENSAAPGEFKRDDKARLYCYRVVADPNDGNVWRVGRVTAPANALLPEVSYEP